MDNKMKSKRSHLRLPVQAGPVSRTFTDVALATGNDRQVVPAAMTVWDAASNAVKYYACVAATGNWLSCGYEAGTIV